LDFDYGVVDVEVDGAFGFALVVVFVDFGGEFAGDFDKAGVFGCDGCPYFPLLVKGATVVQSNRFQDDEASVAKWLVDDALNFDKCHFYFPYLFSP